MMQQKGFTIVETLIALAIVSFGIVSVYGAFSAIVQVTSDISLRFTASYLAQEGVEIIKNIRDGNFINSPGAGWSTGLTSCSAGCQADYKTGTASQGAANALVAYSSNVFLKINSDGLYGYDTGTATTFTRKITITQVDSNTLKVVSDVFWNFSGKNLQTTNEDYLYNWY